MQICAIIKSILISWFQSKYSFSVYFYIVCNTKTCMYFDNTQELERRCCLCRVSYQSWNHCCRGYTAWYGSHQYGSLRLAGREPWWQWVIIIHLHDLLPACCDKCLTHFYKWLVLVCNVIINVTNQYLGQLSQQADKMSSPRRHTLGPAYALSETACDLEFATVFDFQPHWF